jgi:hypothetical protein
MKDIRRTKALIPLLDIHISKLKLQMSLALKVEDMNLSFVFFAILDII